MTLYEKLEQLKKAAATDRTDALDASVGDYLSDELCGRLFKKALHNNNTNFVRALLDAADESRRYLTPASRLIDALLDVLKEGRGRSPYQSTVEQAVNDLFERRNDLTFLSGVRNATLSDLVNSLAARGHPDVAEAVIEHALERGETYPYQRREDFVDEIVIDNGYGSQAYDRVFKHDNLEGLKALQMLHDRDLGIAEAARAAEDGSDTIVNYIYNQGRNDSLRDWHSIIGRYLENGHDEKAVELARRLDEASPTRLDDAIRNEHWELLRVLLERAEERSSLQPNFIDRAIAMGNAEPFFDCLDDAGWSLEQKQLNEALQSTVGYAASTEKGEVDYEATVETLLERGADPVSVLHDRDVLGPLVDANPDGVLSEQRRAGIVDCLCRATDASLQQPITWTMETGSPSAFRTLLEHDPRDNPHYEDLLLFVAEKGPGAFWPIEIKGQIALDYAQPTRKALKALNRETPEFYRRFVKPDLNKRERQACEV